MSGSDIGRTPRTAAEWARDVQQQLDGADTATSVRVGPWVLSTDETGALRGFRSDGTEVVIADAPVDVPDGSLSQPATIEYATDPYHRLQVAQWSDSKDNGADLDNVWPSSGSTYWSPFPVATVAGPISSLHWLSQGTAGQSSYGVGLYKYDPTTDQLTPYWISDNLVGSISSAGWVEREVSLTDETLRVDVGERLFFTCTQTYSGFGSGTRPVGAVARSGVPRVGIMASTTPLPDRLAHARADGGGWGQPQTLSGLALDYRRRIWASVTVET